MFYPPFWPYEKLSEAKKGPSLAHKSALLTPIIKVSQTYWVTYQNLYEKGTKPFKKELAQSDLPVQRKIQKIAQKFCVLAALAALYLTLVTDWLSQWVGATLEFWHKERLSRLETLQTFDQSDV